MTRQLKLVLALSAIGVISAAGASAASATAFHWFKMGKPSISGETGASMKFKTAEGTLEFPKIAVSGGPGEEGVETESSFETSYETIQYPETYNTQWSGQPAQVHMNKCDYRWDPGTVVTCPLFQLKRIEVTVQPGGITSCVVTIPEQELEGTTFTNEGSHENGTVTVDENVTGVEYTTKPGEGAQKCTETTKGTGGTFEGPIKLTGKAGEGSTGIWVE